MKKLLFILFITIATVLQSCKQEEATPASKAEINIWREDENISNGGTYNFGSAASEITSTFTIENLGEGDLQLTGSTLVTVTGGEFRVSQPSTDVIPAGGSTTFEVTFTPNEAVGDSSGSFRIDSNDADEGSYVVNLSGSYQNVVIIGGF